MSAFKIKFIHLLFVTAMILLAATAVLGAGENTPLLPGNLIIEDAYSPGIGMPAGKVLLVQGQAVIIHTGQPKGFYARNNQLLFKDDTLITLNRGRIRIQLTDESIITLASGTKLVLNKSVYDPDNKARSSFVGMDKGKARFLIKKLVEFKQSEFKVKTKTAVAGVRGSEFMIIAADQLTEIMTLADTRLEVVSLATPCKDFKGATPPPECQVKPMILKDYEKTFVRLGELPTQPEAVTAAEVAEMEKDFVVTPGAVGPESAIEGGPRQASGQTGVFVAGVDIPKPEAFVEPPVIEMPPSAADIFQAQPPVNPSEDIIDEIMTDSLPGFPGTPQ
jgi:hypothetical protein